MSDFLNNVPAAPRFELFEAEQPGAKYVLRDNNTQTDYPFNSVTTARKAIKVRVDSGTRLIGSPSESDAYGVSSTQPLEVAA